LPEESEYFAEELNGLDRFVARKLIVARLEDFGSGEDRAQPHMVPTAIARRHHRPYLTTSGTSCQRHGAPAMAAVRSGATTFRAENGRDYFE